MAEPNLNLVTELQTLIRRDFLLADNTILNPLLAGSPGPLLDGEWLELDTASYKLKRGSFGTNGNPAVYPVFVERGRYDTQAVGKVTVLMLGEFEAESKIVANPSALTVGDHLKVGDVTVDGVTGKRGLVKATGGVGASGEVIVGTVTKVLPDRVRFARIPARKIP